MLNSQLQLSLPVRHTAGAGQALTAWAALQAAPCAVNAGSTKRKRERRGWRKLRRPDNKTPRASRPPLLLPPRPKSKMASILLFPASFSRTQTRSTASSWSTASRPKRGNRRPSGGCTCSKAARSFPFCTFIVSRPTSWAGTEKSQTFHLITRRVQNR